MQFHKELRDRVRSGEITCSVRLWQRPHVRVGGRYSLPPGQIDVTSLLEMALSDVTPELSRRSGFAGLVDLLKTAKHGRGRRVFLVEFRYVRPSDPFFGGNPKVRSRQSSMQALRKFALRLPQSEEGVACEGTALESRTIKTQSKAFLFLRSTEARLKLGKSLKEATKLAAKEPEKYRVGAGGWVLVKFDDATDPLDVLQRWVAESHGLFGAKRAGSGSVARNARRAGDSSKRTKAKGA